MPLLPTPEPALPTYGLIGRKLGHSFSPGYFRAKFERMGLRAQYLAFELDELSGLRRLADQHPGLRGLNVTIPYKKEIMSLLDALGPTAQAVGAVNCIVIEPSGGWVGHNTDALGAAEALEALLAGEPCPDALVLGSGGAAAAVRYALSLRPERPVIIEVSRTVGDGRITYADVTPALLERTRLIIQATPLGMYPDISSAPPLPYAALGPAHRLLDLVYNPDETEFLRRGRAQGARGCNGLVMLHAQAEAAWQLWQQAHPAP